MNAVGTPPPATAGHPSAGLQVALTNGMAVVLAAPRLAAGGTTLIGRSADGRHFVKIGLADHPDKANTLVREAAIIRALNDAGCVSCPLLTGTGIADPDAVARLVPAERRAPAPAGGYPALVLPWLETASRIPLRDLLFSIAEQRRLGWFQGDLRPENTRLPPDEKVCHLVDYDQAEPLAEAQRTQPFPDFLRWADARVRVKYAKWNFRGLFHYFPNLELERHVLPLLENGRLDVGATQLFQAQQTTLNASKIYHTLSLEDVFARGERSLDDRERLLDRVVFAPGERVLDVGCNAGLLAAYLARRGCRVTGIDIDPFVIRGARMLANLRGDDTRFACADLDSTELLGDYDTIMLFSVIHHTRNLVANARRIAGACRRIVIECRLSESGAKPDGDRWVGTTVWRHRDVESLIRGLLELFPGFALARNHGQADRGRFLFELVKVG